MKRFFYGLRKFLFGSGSLFLAYGIDLVAIGSFMFGIAHTAVSFFMFGGWGLLLATFKLQAAAKRWMGMWRTAMLLMVFAEVSFFVAQTLPDTPPPNPRTTTAQESLTAALEKQTAFYTERKAAEDANRLSLLKDQYTDEVAARKDRDVLEARHNLEAAQLAALENYKPSPEQIFNRIPQLFASLTFGKLLLFLFALGVSVFMQLLLLKLSQLKPLDENPRNPSLVEQAKARGVPLKHLVHELNQKEQNKSARK